MLTEFMFVDPSTIILVLVVILSFIISVFGFIGNININAGDGSTINLSGLAAQYNFLSESTENIASGEGKKIKISNAAGNIKVISHDSSDIILNKDIHVPQATPEEEKTKAIEVFNKSMLSLMGDVVSIEVPRIVILKALSASINLEVFVPRSFDVEVLPGTNFIQIENIDGKVKLNNNSGEINLANLSGELDINLNSGSVKANNIKNISFLKVNSGDISLNNLEVHSCSSKIEIGAGNIDLDINEIAEGFCCNVMVNTGEANLSVNKQAKVLIEAITDMSELVFDSDIRVLSHEKSFMGASLKGVVNQPGGNLVVRNRTGDVKITLR